MISEVTRLAIIDELVTRRVTWSGRLDEPSFLGRLYDLATMPSDDRRYSDAAGDIWQHRVNNQDWDDDWVFYDRRFNLLRGEDESFLRFLAETVHPAVRRNADEAVELVAMYNEHLRHDGMELARISEISGRPVFAARQRLTVPGAVRDIERLIPVPDTGYLTRQITRMEAAVEADPELAIGTAKELVETVCRTIMNATGEAADTSWDIPRLLKETAKRLQLTPEGVAPEAAAADTIRRVLGSLGSIVAGLAELRNHYGTGHGKSAGYGGLTARHARLAVGAASTLAAFLFETYSARIERSEASRRSV